MPNSNCVHFSLVLRMRVLSGFGFMQEGEEYLIVVFRISICLSSIKALIFQAFISHSN